jgi:hypothetical protein
MARKVSKIIARSDSRRATDKRPCMSLRCRTLVNCRLDVQTPVVVLHLLICNGGKDGIRDHRQGPSHHPATYP